MFINLQFKKLASTSAFRLIMIVVIVIIPINILTLVLSSTTIDEVEGQISFETQSALKLYMSQIDGSIERITAKMHYMAIDNMDFGRMNSSKEMQGDEYYKQLQSAVNLKNTFMDILEDNTWVTGVYSYFPQKDIQVVEGKNVDRHKALVQYLEDIIESNQEKHLRKWEVVKVENSYIILFVAQYKQAYYGAWFDVQRLANILELSNKEETNLVRALVDFEGNVCYATQPDLEKVDLVNKDSKYNQERHILIEAKSKHINLSMIQILSKSVMSNSLPSMIRILQMASILALFILPILIISIKKWMINPVSKLSSAMKKIEEGNMEFRIQEQNSGSEFEVINRNFNQMMDEVSTLKIDVYEEQLEKQQIKMRFLSQQIQPHFILNAMNIIYSYEQDEYPFIQKMILCLSKYFRYVVNANSDFVQLDEEMEHIRNYFEIQQARYPETFFAVVEYEEELNNCLVPPLLIQSFAENAIKHSLTIGNSIDIFVIGQKLGNDKIRIRLVDTGEGIKQELIEKIEKFRETRTYQEGLGVGIQNAIERLEVFYHAGTKFKIAREHPHGTCVEIVLPLYRKEEDQEE